MDASPPLSVDVNPTLILTAPPDDVCSRRFPPRPYGEASPVPMSMLPLEDLSLLLGVEIKMSPELYPVDWPEFKKRDPP